MLKAIEWRAVFGFLFLSFGPLLHVLGGMDNSPVGLGLLATAVPVVIVAIIFKASGIPFRRTLTLLSLPVGFWISLVFAFNGSDESSFFVSGVAAAVAGGLLLLCGYQKEASYKHSVASVVSITISALIIILAPLILVHIVLNEGRLSAYWHPVELVMILSLIVGLMLLQSKSQDRILRLQFASCYGTILTTGMAIIWSVHLYDEYWLQKTRLNDISDSLPVYIDVQLLSLLPLLFAVGFYSVIVLISIAKNKTEDLMLKNWHLSEAYIFLTFMIIAPQSIYETIAGAAG